jgi:homoaconitase/3-isopropylmalate dehydratase large subunit
MLGQAPSRWPRTVTATCTAEWAALGRPWFARMPPASGQRGGLGSRFRLSLKSLSQESCPPGVTGKDVIVDLCGLFNNDEVLNHAIEFTSSEETMISIPIDDRLTIANMTTEWGLLTGLFPIDSALQSWLKAKATMSALINPELGARGHFNHDRISDLLENQLPADPGATYTSRSQSINAFALRVRPERCQGRNPASRPGGPKHQA